MSDKLTKASQYLAQGGKDGDNKDTNTIRTSATDDYTKGVRPAPKVK